MIYNTSKIWKLLDDAEKIYRKLVSLKSTKQSSQRYGRVGCLGLFGPKVDLVEYYEKELEVLEDEARKQQSLLNGKELRAAFVSFKSRIGAAITLNIQQGQNPTEWLTDPAPEDRDIYWAFFSTSFLTRWIGNVVVVLACTALTILFFIPVIIVQGLTNLYTLEILFPFLKGILNINVVSQVITGYLPSLILKTFLKIAPPVMKFLSSIQSYVSHSQIERSACIKVLWFIIWNVFFANALSGSILYRINVFLNPKQIPSILAAAVPGQASFFISYVVTSGWTNTASELLRLTPLIFSYIKRIFATESDEEFEVPSLSYAREIPNILLFGLLGITYFFQSPLILPFLLVYFCMGYLVYRHQLLYVYSPKFETGGQFWPIVHHCTIFSLILMQLIAIGIFGLKQLSLASTLTIPLPIITLLFNGYCQKRFSPLFKGYPVELMTKKDKRDENDPTISEFREKLITAYQDPALKPIKFSSTTDNINAPLLAFET